MFQIGQPEKIALLNGQNHKSEHVFTSAICDPYGKSHHIERVAAYPGQV
jgi:hypothetical protein